MATKKLGHYEGEVEELSKDQYLKLDDAHKLYIDFYLEKRRYQERIDKLNETLEAIKNNLIVEYEIHKSLPDWAWIWEIKKSNVKWKEEFIKVLGAKKAEEITKQYQQKTYPQIGIRFIDPIPETIHQVKKNPKQFPVYKIPLKK